ncbi:MAG: FmdB family transcriptional regulator [Deltaproteobacteria bacterium]|nr:MAG: FmdB family transcriptional regulator [Deltaproteobacteria bacterium]
MPIYEYQCIGCGAVHEVVQKITDAPLETCPSCQGELHKLISHSAFHLKGDGWYVTDYSGSKSSASGNTPDSPGEPAAAPAASSADG